MTNSSKFLKVVFLALVTFGLFGSNLSAFKYDTSFVRTKTWLIQNSALASSLAYSGTKRDFQNAGFTDVSIIKKKISIPLGFDYNMRGVVAKKQYYGTNVFFVAFRGSDNARDWVQNFKANSRTDYSFGNCNVNPEVHNGFSNLADYIRGELVTEAYVTHSNNFAYVTIQAGLKRPSNRGSLGELLRSEELKSGNSKALVVFTGHSMGGAVATYAAVQTACNYTGLDPSNIVINTFGSPAVGKSSFELATHRSGIKNINNVRHSTDIVAGATAIPNYKHVGKAYTFTVPKISNMHAYKYVLKKLVGGPYSLALRSTVDVMAILKESHSIYNYITTVNKNTFR